MPLTLAAPRILELEEESTPFGVANTESSAVSFNVRHSRCLATTAHFANFVSMPRLQWLPPATPIINRRALVSKPSNGHVAFIPQIRKLVFEYCDHWASSANFRRYIYNHIEGLARQNPHVEFVVKQRASKEPIVRGFYRMQTYSHFIYHFTHIFY